MSFWPVVKCFNVIAMKTVKNIPTESIHIEHSFKSER